MTLFVPGSDPIPVRPRTGYVARCRLRGEGGAHYTFGVVNPDGSFIACRDVYYGPREHWDESVLPFRTEGETQLCMYVARRYGSSAILFDAVELVEDDTVRVGDVSPRPNPFPEVTSSETARGYLVAPQPWLRLVYPKLYPTREDLSRRLACSLAPGEYEPATLAITGLRNLTDVQASLQGDLHGDNGTKLPAANVSLGVVSLMKRYLTNTAPLRPGQCYERRPFLIYPNQPFPVRARETRQVWLTVHAPEDQAPGLYRGAVRLTASGAAGSVVPFEVRVLPIKLADPEPTYGMYFRLDWQPKPYQTVEFFRRSMADMRAHGMNSMSLYTNVERKLPDGSWAIDLEQDAGRYSLTHQMEILDEVGLGSPDHPVLFLATGKSDGIFAHEERLVEAVDKSRRERNWPELLFYLVDEPSPARFDLAKQLNDIVHRVPGVRTTTAMSVPRELGDYYDVWIITTSLTGLSDVLTLGQAKGKEVWAYDCYWNGAQPANDRYYCGYHMWVTGLGGNWQWCYTESISGSSRLAETVRLNIPYHEIPWQYNYVLPTPEGNLPTLGWEGRREGIDDYRYLQTLREAIETAPARKQEVARAAQRFLAASGKRMTAPQAPLPASSGDRVYGYVMHPGLGPDDYDVIRQQAAEYIIKLQGR